MVFDKNVVTLRHVGSGFEVQINARDALIACPDTCSGDLLVPCAELWKSAKHVDMEGAQLSRSGGSTTGRLEPCMQGQFFYEARGAAALLPPPPLPPLLPPIPR